MTRSPSGICPSFRSAPRVGQMYLSGAHRQVLDGLVAGLAGPKPLLLLIGDAGTGKTTLAAHLAHLAARDRRVARLANGRAHLVDLHHAVPQALELPHTPAFDDPATSPSAVRAACVAAGQPVLLVIDEAQGLSDAGLDWLACLTGDPPAAGTAPITVLLAGSPDLEARLTRPGLRPVAARVGGRFRLTPFSAEDTAAYIAHRFRIAACPCHPDPNVVDAAGLARLHDLSGGVPRLVNTLVQSCLFEASFSGHATLDGAFVQSCLSSLAADGRLLHLQTPGCTPAMAPAPEVPAPAPPQAADRPPAARPPAPPPRLRATRADPEPPPAGHFGRRAAWAALLAGALILVPSRLPDTALLTGSADVNAAAAVVAPNVPAPTAPRLSPRVGIQPPPDPGDLLTRALALESSDPLKAAPLYGRAALWGSGRAAYYLGQLYETGIGLNADPYRARGWYGAAADNAGAAARLSALAPALTAFDRLSEDAPVPARQLLLSRGQTELHWTDPPSGTVPRFRVQFVLAGEGGVIRQRDTDLTAMLIDRPVTRWRVLALRPDGTEGAASAWSALAPGGR